MKHFLLALLIMLTVLLPSPARMQTVSGDGFATAAFRQLWTRADALVERGQTDRSWIWGAAAGDRRYEAFAEAPGMARLVQYVDKARMELTDPTDPSSAAVTTGLLVVELITGQIQTGYTTFAAHAPATIPVAGDLIDNANAPTYALLGALMPRAPEHLGQRVSATIGAAGVADVPELAGAETQIVTYEPVTGHNVPRVFQDFMQARGPVLVDGQIRSDQVVDPLSTFGYPITEPYWMQVQVGGQPTTVLVQAFERRLLTYTPSNPVPWQVEMGNVGQHYFRWRYGQPLRYAQPPLAGNIRATETTVTIPTYDYTSALLPTTPDDPVYPYPRLDRTRIGALQTRPYRALVVENRFLELTFLPELGGRLYRAVDKASGQNIFYQNPVIKASPFGQRGWWLGVGGLEWASPTEEHGYLEYLPWELTLENGPQGATVRATMREQQTGMLMRGTVDLRADEGRFAIRLEAENTTDAPHPLQMWTNATLSPGGTNTIGPDVRFVAPTDRMIVHATQDPDLPGAGEWIAWPVHSGRDLSRPANWNGYLGAFSPTPVAFLGVYDPTLDAGVAVVHGADTIGAKLFGFSSNFDSALYTDDGSAYVELWSGAQPTFWDYPLLEVGATRTITADWLPLWGIGDLLTATPDGALGVTRPAEGGLTVKVASARIIRDAVMIVQIDGQEVFRTIPLDLRPDQPLSIDLPLANAAGTHIRVEAPGFVIE